jgi:hypothetical protein
VEDVALRHRGDDVALPETDRHGVDYPLSDSQPARERETITQRDRVLGMRGAGARARDLDVHV